MICAAAAAATTPLQGVPPDLKAMAQHVAGTSTSSSSSSGGAKEPGCAIMVDCTASEGVPDHYVTWMSLGCHIATPNKKLGAGPLERYNAVRQQQRASGTHFMYEVRCGGRLGGTGGRGQGSEGARAQRQGPGWQACPATLCP
jgi:hypothetical protein